MELTPTQRLFLADLAEYRYVTRRGLKIAPLREAGLMAVVDGRWVITGKGRDALKEATAQAVVGR